MSAQDSSIAWILKTDYVSVVECKNITAVLQKAECFNLGCVAVL